MRRSACRAGTFGLAAIAACLGACREADSVVLVTVTAESGATGVVQMRATISNDAMSATNQYPQQLAAGAAAIAFPTMFSFTVARGRSGTLDVAIDGLDARGMAIANGDGSVALSPGETTELAVTLRGGASLCGNKVIDTGEACDDGNRVSEGICDFTCHHAGSIDAGGMGGSGGGGTGMGGGFGTDGGHDTGNAGGRDGGTDGGSIDGGQGDSGRGDVASGDGGPAVCTKELLLNGDFNLGSDDWSVTSSGRLLVYDENSVDPASVPTPHSPPDLAWLGYDVISETAMLQQIFNVPINALSLTVSGYYIINTSENACDCDDASIDLVSPVYTHQVQSWSNRDYNSDWTYFTTTFDISLAAGDDLTLQVSAKMDDGVITSFFFDDLSVTASFCR